MYEKEARYIRENVLVNSDRKFILGTDWWTDCDDCIAMQLLCLAHKHGAINLIGVGINACMEYSAPSVCAYLEDAGLSDIPIGIDLEATDFTGVPKYQKRMAPKARRIKNNTEAENAVKLYRRLLSESEGNVEILEIGFCQVLAGLLESLPDDISPLSGIELLQEKVSKIWVMAGKWDEQGGREHNFSNNLRASLAAEKLLRLCPCEMTFLGWEIGVSVISASVLKGKDTFTANAMLDNGMADGRDSWDPMLVLLAIIGDEKKAGYKTVRGKATVDPKTGANYFTEDACGRHCYVIKAEPNDFYKNVIDKMLLWE